MEEMQANSTLMEKRFELILQMEVKKLKKEIDDMRNTMLGVTSELHQFKREVFNKEPAQAEQFSQPSNGAAYQYSQPAPQPNGAYAQQSFVPQQPAQQQAVPQQRNVPIQAVGGEARATLQQARQSPAGEKPKPRYGDFKPEDVDISKFFSFGGSRRI